MDVNDLRAGDGYEVEWSCRDIGYGVEADSGVYVYRGRDRFGKYTFEDARGDFIYLFEDEILSVESVEARLFRVTLEAFVKPKVVTWERFAFSEEQAARQAVEAGEREWPNAAVVRCAEVAATIPSVAQRREP